MMDITISSKEGYQVKRLQGKNSYTVKKGGQKVTKNKMYSDRRVVTTYAWMNVFRYRVRPLPLSSGSISICQTQRLFQILFLFQPLMVLSLVLWSHS